VLQAAAASSRSRGCRSEGCSELLAAGARLARQDPATPQARRAGGALASGRPECLKNASRWQPAADAEPPRPRMRSGRARDRSRRRRSYPRSIERPRRCSFYATRRLLDDSIAVSCLESRDGRALAARSGRLPCESRRARRRRPDPATRLVRQEKRKTPRFATGCESVPLDRPVKNPPGSSSSPPVLLWPRKRAATAVDPRRVPGSRRASRARSCDGRPTDAHGKERAEWFPLSDEWHRGTNADGVGRQVDGRAQEAATNRAWPSGDSQDGREQKKGS